jgi:hypothetical protein
MSKWAYCVLLLPPAVPTTTCELEAAKRRLLQHSLVPVLTPRRWFFRREALPSDLPRGSDERRSFRLYVELQPADTPQHLTRALVAAPAAFGLQAQVHHVEDWDGCFGSGYGGPQGDAAMRDFCAEAAPVAILDRRDPVDVASKHMSRGLAPEAGVLHWWAQLREGCPVPQDLEPRLWQDACAAHRAGLSPRY